jgi:hypothetical protein
VAFVMLGSIPTPLGVVCTLVIIVASIITAADFNELIERKPVGEKA